MYSEYNIEKTILKLKDSLWFNYDENNKILLNKVDGAKICSLSTLTEKLRIDAGCNFESIYAEDLTLTNIYRCRTCGCVIFTGDDERYEPNLRCPVCTDYKPMCNYWTKEEIEIDIEKSQYIDMLIYMKNINIISNIFSHTLKFKNKSIKFGLYHDDKHYFKGMHLKIAIVYDNSKVVMLKYNKYFDIPLSISYYKSMKKIKRR